MFKVECERCHAPYQVDERRVPPAGLKMRCPKCSTTFVVRRPEREEVSTAGPAPVLGALGDLPREGSSASSAPTAASSKMTMPFASTAETVAPEAAPPEPAKPPPPRPGAPKAPPRAGKQTMVGVAPAAAAAAARAAGEATGDSLMDHLPGAPGSSNGSVSFGAAEVDPQDAPTAVRKVTASFDADASLGATSFDLGITAPPAPMPPPAEPKPSLRGGAQAETAYEFDLGGLDSIAGPPPAAPSPSTASQLPAPPPGSLFGEIDLPTRATGDSVAIGLPQVSHGGGAGLPSLSSGGLPAIAGGLPAVASGGLPSVAGVGLPSAQMGGLPAITGIGLPSVAQPGLPIPTQAGLPAPASAGLPASGGAGLPAPRPGKTLGFGEIDLPLFGSDASSGLEAAIGSVPQPQQASSADLSFASFPPVAPGSSSISSAGGSTASAPFFAPDGSVSQMFPGDASRGADSIVRQGGGGTSFGEVNLAGDGLGGDFNLGQPREEMEFGAVAHGSHAAPMPGAPSTDLGGIKAPTGTGPVVELPKKASNKGRFAAALLLVLAIAGGSMEIATDYGAFGRHWIMDRVNRDANKQHLDSNAGEARKALGADTFSDANRGIALIDVAVNQRRRVFGLPAYGAYAGYSTLLRFGKSPAIEAHAKQQLADLPTDRPVDYAELGRAAQAAATGQVPRARQMVEGLLRKDPRDVDAAVLAGEIELVAKDPKKAIEAWKRAVQVDGGTPRSVFGLARAFYAGGDEASAIDFGKKVIERAPNHAGARILVARAAWESRRDEATAMKLLAEVTASGPVKLAASPTELVDALTLIGRVHIARSRMTQADVALAEALKLDPKSASALTGSGEVFYRQGRFTEALARFEAAMQADPESSPAKIGAAKTRLKLERLQEARDMLKTLHDQKPGEVEAGYWLGVALEQLGDKVAAEAAYKEAIKVGDAKLEVVEPYIALAQLLSAQERSKEAEEVLAEARKKLPDSTAIHKAIGDVDLQAGRLAEAKTEFEAALKIEPDDLQSKFKLGQALRRLKMNEPAFEIFEQVAAADKEYPGLAVERGLLYEQSGRQAEALESYRQALAKAPDDPDLMLRVGGAEVSNGHPAQAKEMLKKVMLKRPNSAEVNHFMGRALLLEGTNLAEALRYLKHAVELDPNRPEYHLYVAWAANEAGQLSLAQDEIRLTLELDKSLGDAWWQKGVLNQKQGAVRDAEKYLKRALELKPSRYEAYATLAECYGDQQRWPEALASWRRAIESDGTKSYWHYRLGKLLQTRGGSAPTAGIPELQIAITQEEQRDTKAGWLTQAYFDIADAFQNAGRNKDAVDYYNKYLTDAKTDSAYRKKALKELTNLGSPWERD